ncbi:DEAD/DEAH box helicase [Dictyobacter formicarum]|uniref:DNA helicase n=1 Tax=Dictyobacter formicarum TaxID=2778368 RepID=A0ABQ3V840_9CHLR|nr:ATP-binding domain-containing protein [Dictyobacter formicarum]GHO82280.1 hypothetical protein KSZ_02860 [Dictyobacter formicarum]
MDFTWTNDKKPTYAAGKVWQELKTALQDEEGVCYHGHPIFSAENTQLAPDIMCFHKQWGLYVIECKPWRLTDIQNIQNDVWFINQLQESPYSTLEDQLYNALSHFTREKRLRNGKNNLIEGHLFLALPNIYRSEWEKRGLSHNLDKSHHIIFAEDLKPALLKACLQKLPEEEQQMPLTEESWKIALSILKGSNILKREQRSFAQKPDTKAAYLQNVEEQIQLIDSEQESIALKIPEGPQRIRGIAGSGKTVVMCMKVAAMHIEHPEWEIAYTFYTRNLFGQVKNLITRFYKNWSHLSDRKEPDWTKIHILHGWGGKDAPGLYSLIAKNLDVEPLTFSEAKNSFKFKEQSELLGRCCKQLLDNKKKIPPIYDAILIDEAQDFHFDFYKLCYVTLKSPKRLIWAYDEVQSLESLSIPTTIEIFGTNKDGSPIVDLEGTYKIGENEEVEKDLVLYRCYRNPRPVLVAAHIFGMGLKRAQGAVQFIPTQGGWEDIGYRIVEGKFEPGQKVTIQRPEDNSPHRLETLVGYENLVKWQAFNDRNEELDWIARQIATNIKVDGLRPEEIAVVCLDWRQMHESFNKLDFKLSQRGIQVIIAGKKGNKEIFHEEGKVTLAGIFRAKGNEASVVYVMGFDQVDTNPKLIVQDRNQAFTAMTRTRGWCILTGTGGKAKALFKEIDEIISSGPDKITFTVPDPKTIQRNLDSLEYERRRNRIKKVKDLSSKLEGELAELKDTGLLQEIIGRLQVMQDKQNKNQ